MKIYCNFIPDPDEPTNTCCHQHDREYGIRGTISREQADLNLRNCLIKCGKSKPFAYSVWLTVRAFGWVCYKKKDGVNP